MAKHDTKKAPVTEIRKPIVEETKPANVVRWIVPVGTGPAHAHAHRVDAALTLCKGAHAIGGVYPPAPGVPRCHECAAILNELRDAGK